MANSQSNASFPPGFLWGAATASYQIEGAHTAGGRGESIWDRFSHTPGKTHNGDNGDVACDHYHRWRDDVTMMRDVGLNAYRFSVAWPRILPSGKGRVNQEGLDFYDRLVDALLDSGIRPFVTLYHWDLPQALQDEGGWGNRDTAQHFVEYVQVVAERLGDRVEDWITHNEPQVAAFVGHLQGRHAPGIMDRRIAYQASHNLLLSHGLAVSALKTILPGARVGITLDLVPTYPASDSDADKEAAHLKDSLHNRWFLDPLFKGHYPDVVLMHIGSDAPQVEEGDLEIIRAPIDFLGINYYTRAVMARAAMSEDPARSYMGITQTRPEGSEYTEMDWEVYPQGLHDLLVRVNRDYPLDSYYITENGAAFADMVSPDGTVRDERRISYLEGHLEACARAISEDVPLKGYFLWSLMDNFEWALGYSKRFGIVYVDYPTQRRVLKNSARWYSRFIDSNGNG